MLWNKNEERKFFVENLSDDDLAQAIAEADTPSAVGLLLEQGLNLLAVKLWRQRTGDDLKTAVEAVQALTLARQHAPNDPINE